MTTYSVAQVLTHPVVQASGPTVLAGHGALDQPVRWVHSAELADIAPLLREGDLLLSTGIAMPTSPVELDRFACSLADSGAAGLVIELGRRWDRLPTSLIESCVRLDLPLVSLSREVRFAAIVQAVGEQLVTSQLTDLREAQRVHDTFTQLSIDEAGPSHILAAVQRLAGTTVVLESAAHEILEYRSGPGDVSAFVAGWAARSRQVQSGGRTTWDAEQKWLVSRVGKRERRWGRLVVQAPLAPNEAMVALIERAAAALALHRLHDRHRDNAVRRTHHDLLVRLLADPTDPDLLRRCEIAGLPTQRRQFVGIALRPPPGSTPGLSREALLDEVIGATVRAADQLRVPVLVCESEQDVRALVSLARSSDPERVVNDLAARVVRRHHTLVAAGRPVSEPPNIDRTLREAQQVLQAARGNPHPGRVYRLDDVHLRGLLALLADDDRVALFVDRQLAALRDHDHDHHGRLVDAVRALVAHPTNKAAAAASLGVSRPVLYDRLSKAGRVLGVDLDDPHIRTSLHVAVLAEEVASGHRGH